MVIFERLDRDLGPNSVLEFTYATNKRLETGELIALGIVHKNMPIVKRLFFERYTRRKPEADLFYRTIKTYWPKFINEQQRVASHNIPEFVKNEFENYLNCGIPENGFVRTYCYTCRLTGIVAFSCKQRGFCPSCCARRMNDEAAHLVDNVLPRVKYRQWVLSFPYKLRYLMAYNSSLTNSILSIYVKEISKFYKRKYKATAYKKISFKELKSGSVTFIQRFGSALNFNAHFHTLFADGVFIKQASGDYSFHALNELDPDDLHQITERIRIKVNKILNKLDLDESQLDFSDNTEDQLLNQISKASIGNKIQRHGDFNSSNVASLNLDPYSFNNEGFSLNAKVVISGCDTKKLEKLIRYMSRGPIATKRLTEFYPNGLLYELKTPWRDGTTHVSFTPLEFISRLVALIPPPGLNMIRYHGVFAPNFKDRELVVIKSPPKSENTAKGKAPLIAVVAHQKNVFYEEQLKRKQKRERMRWSDILKRTFEIDVTTCFVCKGRVEQIAAIKDKTAAKAILKSLNETSILKPIKLDEDRGPPPHVQLFSEFFDESDSREYSQETMWSEV